MPEERKVYWIWLAELFGQGSRLAVKIANIAGGACQVYEGFFDSYEPDEEFDEETLTKVKRVVSNRSLARAEEIIRSCEKIGIAILTPESSDYPMPLRSLQDMPLVLYMRGRLPNCERNFLTTVVGTRSMTDYGRRIAYSLGAGLAFGGAIVVSGMALGSDSMALIGALECGGTAVAVLGSGVDVIYPREHTSIYNKILEQGAIISEYPPGSPPSGHHFPVRNRIMSGLSDATVVVEADAKSGSLITARKAVDQGRKLFAVPGKIGESGAEGTNALICDGAIPVLTAEDILAEFEFLYPGRVNVQNAHAKLHRMDMNVLSHNAMMRMRIGTSSGGKNYYGRGSYGGRLDDVEGGKNTSDNTVGHKATKNLIDEKSQKTEKKENKNQKTKKQTVNSDKKIVPAKKIELDTLDEIEIKVYNNMKPNVPTLPDELVSDEFTIDVIMSSLIMLEMAGAVEVGGGGYYMRVSPDDIMQSEND